MYHRPSRRDRNGAYTVVKYGLEIELRYSLPA